MTQVENDIPIVYFDEQIVVVNKPSGLLSVPGRGEDKWDCVVHRVQLHYPTARIVHRLDCATSGLMILALDSESHRELSRQFHDREVDKRYEAVVFGSLEHDSGEVDQPLIADWPNRPRQKIDHELGKHALTHYACLSRFENDLGHKLSRVSLTPVTGRSHQLRVHMLYLDHPIIGDKLYAEGEAKNCVDRLYLHACELSITHPISGELIEFKNSPSF